MAKKSEQINVKDAESARLLAWLARDDVRRKVRRGRPNMTATLYDVLNAEFERRKAETERTS